MLCRDKDRSGKKDKEKEKDRKDKDKDKEKGERAEREVGGWAAASGECGGAACWYGSILWATGLRRAWARARGMPHAIGHGPHCLELWSLLWQRGAYIESVWWRLRCFCTA